MRRKFNSIFHLSLQLREKRGEKTTKNKLFRTFALAIFLVSVVGLPQAYGKTIAPPGQIWPYRIIYAVSNPTGRCPALGLQGAYGTLVVTRLGITIDLQRASPNKHYTVLVGYKQSTGSCDGTWKPVGSFNTDASGRGKLSARVSLPSGHQYVFEIKDDTGNMAYATATLGM